MSIDPDKIHSIPAAPLPNVYPGSKGGNGVTERLINNVPPIDTLFIPFAGKCALTRKLSPVRNIILCDLDPEVCKWWKRQRLPNIRIENSCGIKFAIANAEQLNRSNCLTYADPPHPRQTTTRSHYKFMLNTGEHAELLSVITTELTHPVMISTYPNKQYQTALSNWQLTEYNAPTRGKPKPEWLFQNFCPLMLHDYSKLGSNKTERLNLNRRSRNLVNGIQRLTGLERLKQIAAVVSAFPTEVSFMSKQSDACREAESCCHGRNEPPRLIDVFASSDRPPDLPGQLDLWIDDDET